jgi:hypothetical protein
MVTMLFDDVDQGRVRGQGWLWLAVIGTALVLAQTLSFGFGYDHGIMGYMGWAILHGYRPYTDIWEIQFPGGVLVHAFVIAIGGTSALSLRVFDWVVQILTAVLIFSLAKRLGGPRAGTVSALLYATTYAAGGYYHTAQRDGFIVPLLLLGVWSLWRYALKPKARWIIVAGISLGTMCIFRPTYMLLIAALMGYVLIAPSSSHRSLLLRFRDILWLAPLCALPMVLVIVVLAYNGELSTFFRILSVGSVIYPPMERVSAHYVLNFAARSAPQVLWAGTAMSALVPAIRKRLWPYCSLWITLGTCMLIRLLELKDYLYQYWPLYACGSVMAGAGLNFGVTALVRSAQLPQRWKRTAIVLITGMVMLWPIYYAGGLLLGLRTAVPSLRQRSASRYSYQSLVADSADQAEVARYLHEHTNPMDTIQLWGAEPGILYAAGRFSASRFLETVPFLCEGGAFFTQCERNRVFAVQQSWKNEFLESMETQCPLYIVAHYSNGSLAVAQGASYAPDFPELRELLSRDYEIETTIGIWSVFRKKREHQP